MPAVVYAFNCTRNAATGYCSYYILFGRDPRLSIDVEFGLQKAGQKLSPRKSTYIEQLKMRLRYAPKKEKQVAPNQQERHKELYD